jgi:hypothetical protein
VKNAAIIRALPQLKLLKGDLKSLDFEIESLQAQVANLTKQREQLDAEIKTLSSVTAVIDGIAVAHSAYGTSYGNDYRIQAVDRTVGLSAEVYTNAHTSENGVAKDWCIKVRYPRDEHGRDNDKWLGDGWPYRDAVEAARRWVTLGELPSEQQQQLSKARHKFDPKGEASKRRRLAFEAAWLAGHEQLAEDILCGRTQPSTKAKEEVHA